MLIQAVKDAGSRSASRRIEIAAWMQTPRFERVCKSAVVKRDEMFAALKGLLLSDGVERVERAQRIVRVLATGQNA